MKADRQDEAAIDRILRAGLAAPAGGSDQCPEAGDLAAFVEGELARDEREAIERHAAQCARCQQALALVGSVPPHLRTTPSAAGWLLAVRPRWALPAVIIALAVVLYAALGPLGQPPAEPTDTRAASQPAALQPEKDRSLVAENFPAAAPAAPATPPAASALASPSVGSGLAGPPTRQPRSGAEAGTTPRAEARATRERAKLPDAAPIAPRLDAIEERAVTAPASARPAVVPQLPAQAAQQAPGQQAPTQLVQAQRNALTQVQSVQGGIAGGVAGGIVGGLPEAPPPKATAARQIGPVGETVQVAAAAGGGKPAATIIAAPDRSVLWRIDAMGALSRSRDEGRTWLAITAAPSDLLAGSAPTPGVCWLVGRGGAVLLTVDGERWEQRPFSERIDLVKVEARDARNATVIARDGRRFITTDGGATWK